MSLVMQALKKRLKEMEQQLAASRPSELIVRMWSAAGKPIKHLMFGAHPKIKDDDTVIDVVAIPHCRFLPQKQPEWHESIDRIDAADLKLPANRMPLGAFLRPLILTKAQVERKLRRKFESGSAKRAARRQNVDEVVEDAGPRDEREVRTDRGNDKSRPLVNEWPEGTALHALYENAARERAAYEERKQAILTRQREINGNIRRGWIN